MKAVILESYVMEEGDLDWSGVKALVPDTTSYVRTDYADIAPRIGDAELVLINKCRIDEAVLAQCPNLKWVGIIATGTDNIDLEACRRHVLAGLGGVISFLPQILVLFLLMSILEDSGYMARVAFVMDKLLRKIGLSGRSFVPMIIGFGCSVPAIMATRTLPSERDRKMTIMLTPFMSCSAKLPIYAMFTAAFFPRYGALVMTALYFTGIIVAIIYALILNHTKFKALAGVLPTIRSRCVSFAIAPVSPADCARYCTAHGVDKKTAVLYSELFDGHIGTAFSVCTKRTQ